MATEKELSFEDSLAKLEQIVTELETGDIPLEKALSQFKKGIQLSQNCQETLTEAEKTLTKIMTEDNQEVVFEEGEPTSE